MKQFNRTEKFIHKALVDLMSIHSFSSITVIMIAKQAEINRKTFYSYYNSKENLYSVMMEAIFTNLFSCFMYEKQDSDKQLDISMLEHDIRSFLMMVEDVHPILELMITEETSKLALEAADKTIYHLGDKTYFNEASSNLIPKRFYVEIIRNFFLGMIDCLYEGEIKTIDEGVVVMMKIMSSNQLNAFQYIKKY